MSNTTDLDELVPWQEGPTERGGYSIIFSCLAVVITSTWTVLHLNLPGPRPPVRAHIGSYKLFDISWSTIRKTKWMCIMIIFPELVFAYAILELRMALDDYILMNKQHEAMYQKGWCISAGSWNLILHDVLSGRWPALKISTSSSWPWLGIVSKKKKWGYHKQTAAQQNKDEHKDTVQSITTGDDGTSPGPVTANTTIPHHGDDCVPFQPTEASQESDSKPKNNNLMYFNQSRDTHSHVESQPHKCEEKAEIRQIRIWTVTHVYFANMGGIRCASEIVPANYLARSLNCSPSDSSFDLMNVVRMSEAEIQDKSKADTLVRLVWMSQILRLCFEVLARAVVGLAVTQLEIITLSFSVLSAAIYIVQWNKPKDVEEPIELEHESVRIVEDDLNRFASLGGTYLARRGNPEFMTERISNDIFREEHERLFITMLEISTVVFGSIHCGAWNFSFPSAEEKWLWRSCAISGIVLPLVGPLLALPIPWEVRRLEKNHSSLVESIKPFVESVLRKTEDEMQFYYRREEPANALFDGIQKDFPDSEKAEDRKAGFAKVKKAVAKEKELLARREKLWKNRRFYQLPLIVIYLVTRLILIIIAFTSFRKAPRGTYKDTWAAFVPTFQ
jgi:hypothetical protein